MQQVGFPQPNRAVSPSLLIDQERELDTGFLPENACIVLVAQPYGSKARSFFFEFLLMFAQLRDVLAAKDSTIVAKKNDHRRCAFPKRPESDFAAIGVRK